MPDKDRSVPLRACLLPAWLPISLWDEFRKTRKKIKAPMTDYAETLILDKLDRWHTEGYDTIGIINESIERSWRGVFLNGFGKKCGNAQMKEVCCTCSGTLDS